MGTSASTLSKTGVSVDVCEEFDIDTQLLDPRSPAHGRTPQRLWVEMNSPLDPRSPAYNRTPMPTSRQQPLHPLDPRSPVPNTAEYVRTPLNLQLDTVEEEKESDNELVCFVLCHIGSNL